MTLTHLGGEGVSSGPLQVLCPIQGRCPDDSEPGRPRSRLCTQQGATATEGMSRRSRRRGPAAVSRGRRQPGRDSASVPPDLDGGELPEVGLAHV